MHRKRISGWAKIEKVEFVHNGIEGVDIAAKIVPLVWEI